MLLKIKMRKSKINKVIKSVIIIKKCFFTKNYSKAQKNKYWL